MWPPGDSRHFEIAWREFDYYARNRAGQIVNAQGSGLSIGPGAILGSIPGIGPIIGGASDISTIKDGAKLMSMIEESLNIQMYGPSSINENTFIEMFGKPYDSTLTTIIR